MIDPRRRLVQPGPPADRRFDSVAGSMRTLSAILPPGDTLLASVSALFAREGWESGALEMVGGAFAPFAYVRPAHSPDGRHVAYYSATHRPAGETRLERAAATFGQREGRPFLHVHGIWSEPDGERRGGHVLTDESVIAAPIALEAWGSPAVAITAREDPETGFTLFHPQPRPAAGRAAPRLVVARVRPNEDACEAVEAVCRAHGVSRARVRGTVGSLVGALFHDAPGTADIATEAFVLEGRVVPDDEGAPRASLTVALADMEGRVHQGTLVHGANPICITMELTLEEETA